MRNAAELTSHELKDLPRQSTVWILPVAGLEDLGPHLEMGFRLAECTALCGMISTELESKLEGHECVLLPLLPIATDSAVNFGFFSRPHVLRDAVFDTLERLRKEGFQKFLIVSTTLGSKQLTALDEACTKVSRFRKKVVAVSVGSAWVAEGVVTKNPFLYSPKEQGGETDTSIALCLDEDRVRETYRTLSPIPKEGRIGGAPWSKPNAYWGDPSRADPRRGAETLQARVNSVLPMVLQILQKGRGGHYFRTLYRLNPLNWSFFFAYLIGLAFGLSMLMMVIWSFKDFYE
jgi:creatinine amidohydrolase/Fe(II)-dependent formamide hydrolase-like protein